MIVEELTKTFQTFAERECKDSSELYFTLATEISKDSTLLKICTYAQTGQPVPNLLFGAVHFLLLQGAKHELRYYYPSLVGEPKPTTQAFYAFKDFCVAYQNDIIEILKTRIVQTNEVRRCAYLYPAFGMVYETVNKPLALIEIGTSAGLQLLWDQYAYSYEINEIVGNVQSELLIFSDVTGTIQPPIYKTAPPITERIGFDLNIVDLTRENEKIWLKSLIWPEHHERLALFDQAADYLGNQPLELVEGDGIKLLKDRATKIPKDHAICVFHTHVANQMTREMKQELLNTVGKLGETWDVFHIYNNIQDRYLHLDAYIDGVEYLHTIAETDGHARWMKWLMNERVIR